MATPGLGQQKSLNSVEGKKEKEKLGHTHTYTPSLQLFPPV